MARNLVALEPGTDRSRRGVTLPGLPSLSDTAQQEGHHECTHPDRVAARNPRRSGRCVALVASVAGAHEQSEPHDDAAARDTGLGASGGFRKVHRPAYPTWRSPPRPARNWWSTVGRIPGAPGSRLTGEFPRLCLKGPERVHTLDSQAVLPQTCPRATLPGRSCPGQPIRAQRGHILGHQTSDHESASPWLVGTETTIIGSSTPARCSIDHYSYRLSKMRFMFWLVPLIGLSGGVWALLSLSEGTLNPKLKDKVSWWLMGNTPIELSDRWPSTFLTIYDTVFGDKKFSLRFGFVSAAISIFFFAVLLLVWGILHPQQFSSFFYQGSVSGMRLILLVFVLTNIVPDYLSNCQSRWIIGRLRYSERGFLTYVVWIVLDGILTAVLSLLFVILVSAVVNCVLEWPGLFGGESSSRPILDVRALLSLQSSDGHILPAQKGFFGSDKIPFRYPPYGVFFYTTFLTSLSLWLYGLCGAVVAFLHRFLGPGAFIFKWLDFDCHPLSSLGALMALVIATLYILTSVLVRVF